MQMHGVKFANSRAGHIHHLAAASDLLFFQDLSSLRPLEAAELSLSMSSGSSLKMFPALLLHLALHLAMG